MPVERATARTGVSRIRATTAGIRSRTARIIPVRFPDIMGHPLKMDERVSIIEMGEYTRLGLLLIYRRTTLPVFFKYNSGRT